ncbi:unnamed protein product [Gadus morhua 'NCC']
MDVAYLFAAGFEKAEGLTKRSRHDIAVLGGGGRSGGVGSAGDGGCKQRTEADSSGRVECGRQGGGGGVLPPGRTRERPPHRGSSRRKGAATRGGCLSPVQGSKKRLGVGGGDGKQHSKEGPLIYPQHQLVLLIKNP